MFSKGRDAEKKNVTTSQTSAPKFSHTHFSQPEVIIYEKILYNYSVSRLQLVQLTPKPSSLGVGEGRGVQSPLPRKFKVPNKTPSLIHDNWIFALGCA